MKGNGAAHARWWRLSPASWIGALQRSPSLCAPVARSDASTNTYYS